METRKKKEEVKEEDSIPWSNSTGEGRVKSECGKWAGGNETVFTRDCNTPSMSGMLIAREYHTPSISGMQSTAVTEADMFGSPRNDGSKNGCRSPGSSQDDKERMCVGPRR